MSKTILALGDSLCAGFGLPVHSSFISQLQKALKDKGWSVQVINAGISGDNTSGGLYRVDHHLQAEPDLVFLELGINDGAMGHPTQQIQANLQAIIDKVLARGAAIILAGTNLPPEFDTQYRHSFSAIFSSLARMYELPLIPDLLQGVLGNPDLTLMDGLHPNAQGVQHMVRQALPEVEKALQQLA